MKEIKAWMVIGENGNPAIASERDNYISLTYRRVKKPTKSHWVVPCTITYELPTKKKK